MHFSRTHAKVIKCETLLARARFFERIRIIILGFVLVNIVAMPRAQSNIRLYSDKVIAIACEPERLCVSVCVFACMCECSVGAHFAWFYLDVCSKIVWLVRMRG